MDRDVVVWLSEHRTDALDALAAALAAAGTGGLVWIGGGIAVALLRRQLAIAFGVAAIVWGSDLIALALRHLIGRVRPYEAIPGVDVAVGFGGTGPSLPSGHAASGFAGAVVLGYLVRRALPWLLLGAALVAVSRVYAGFHYPSDVLAGAGLGIGLGLVGIAVLRRVQPGSWL